MNTAREGHIEHIQKTSLHISDVGGHPTSAASPMLLVQTSIDSTGKG